MKYVTKSGLPVRIYHVGGAIPYTVHGAVQTNDGWVCQRWMSDGSFHMHCPHIYDLVEEGTGAEPTTIEMHSEDPPRAPLQCYMSTEDLEKIPHSPEPLDLSYLSSSELEAVLLNVNDLATLDACLESDPTVQKIQNRCLLGFYSCIQLHEQFVFHLRREERPTQVATVGAWLLKSCVDDREMPEFCTRRLAGIYADNDLPGYGLARKAAQRVIHWMETGEG